MLGTVGIHLRDDKIDFYEISYWIAPAFTNRGFASQACQLATKIALNVCMANRLEIGTAKSNIASQMVAEKAGFEFEARLANRCVGLTGRPDDAFIYLYPN